MLARGRGSPKTTPRHAPIGGDASFDQIAIVYYPGVDHMKALIHSSFMAGIGGDKQPGDSLAVVTVPILSRL